MRYEHDSIGAIEVPDNVYYSAQTARAMTNFPISGIPISHHEHLLRGFAMVKIAAARANVKLQKLDPAIGSAIEQAAQEILAGRLHDQFTVDVMQGGAGTSTNMNFNEVLANRALELSGHKIGEFEHIHPNDHVNLSQSTNDTYPTAVRLAIILAQRSLSEALDALATVFEIKAGEFYDIVKLGRTEMQDAVPMTLGQEFGAFATTIREDIARLVDAVELLTDVNLGGTAIGTRINADPTYGPIAIKELSELCGLPLTQSGNLLQASWDMGAFVISRAARLPNPNSLHSALTRLRHSARSERRQPRVCFATVHRPPPPVMYIPDWCAGAEQSGEPPAGRPPWLEHPAQNSSSNETISVRSMQILLARHDQALRRLSRQRPVLPSFSWMGSRH